MKNSGTTWGIVAGLLLVGAAGFFLWGGSPAPGTGAGEKQPENTNTAEEPREYQSDKYHFSFSYPGVFGIVEYNENGVDYLLLQDTSTEALQIAVSSFDEPLTVLTEERIRKDLPDLVMEEVSTHSLDNGAIQALSFSQPDIGQGKTKAAWFVTKGHLYQVSMRADFENALERVLDTIHFSESTQP